MVTVRPATLDDITEIHAMICDLSAFHGDAAQVTPSQLGSAFFGPTPMATALIAELDNHSVGYAGLTPTLILHEGKIRLDIHHLFVKSHHRTCGVGTGLIAAAKAYAIKTGATRLTIGTDPNNATAIAAYRAIPALTEMSNGGPRFRVDLSQ